MERRQHVADEIVVGEGDALGVAGRSGGVDQRENVVRFDLVGALPEEIAGIPVAAGIDHLIHGQHTFSGRTFDLNQILEIRTPVLDLEELGHLIGILDHRGLGASILGLKGDLRRVEGAVDRAVHRTEIDNRKIGHMPLGAVVHEQHDAIAAADAELFESTGEPRRSLEEGGGAQDPLAVGREVGVMLVARCVEVSAVQVENIVLGHGEAPLLTRYAIIPRVRIPRIGST